MPNLFAVLDTKSNHRFDLLYVFFLSTFVKANETPKIQCGSFHYCHQYVFEAMFWQKIGLSEMPERLLPREIDIYSIGVTLYKSISNKLPFIASNHKSMYILITEKEKNSVRGIEVNCRYFYGEHLPKCSLQGHQKKAMTQLLVQLLKVNIFIMILPLFYDK